MVRVCIYLLQDPNNNFYNSNYHNKTSTHDLHHIYNHYHDNNDNTNLLLNYIHELRSITQ